MANNLHTKARMHLQLALLVVAFLSSLAFNNQISLTGATVLPSSVERYVPAVTIILGVLVVIWTVYLFFVKQDAPTEVKQ